MSAPTPVSQSPCPDESTVREVAARLRRVYGLSRLGNQDDPLDELIFIILSGRTQESTYTATFEALRRRFSTWDEAARAGEAEIRQVIQGGGLAGKKARAIARLLAAIRERVGCADLGFLRGLADASAEAFLCSLPGVGPKTARCVLAYSLGRPTFAVDVHVSRIVRRLGWSRHHRLTDRVQDRLQACVPPDVRLSLHVNFIFHGRLVCTKQKPRCGECVLADLCPSKQRSGDDS